MNSISSCFHSRDNLEAARFFRISYLFSYKNPINMQNNVCILEFIETNFSERMGRNTKAKVAVDCGGPAARPLQLRWKFERIARACRSDWWDRESHRRRRRCRIVVAFGVLRVIHARSIVRKITLTRARFGGRYNCLEREKGKKRINETDRSVTSLRFTCLPTVRVTGAAKFTPSRTRWSCRCCTCILVTCECVLYLKFCPSEHFYELAQSNR